MRFHVIIILLLFPVPVIGQVYYSEHLTTTEGLPSNSIRCVFKDSRGFLWIGTDGGASRYDGITFRNYNSSNGLVGDQVWSIVEDDKGALWFGCYGAGITSFDGKRFISYTEKRGLVDPYVRVLHFSTDQNCLVIGTNRAISILANDNFTNFSNENGKLKQAIIVTSILENDTSFLILSFIEQNYRIDKRNNFNICNADNLPFQNTFSSSSFIDSRGDTVIGFERRGMATIKQGKVTLHDSIGQVFGIAEDCQGTLWLAAWNGGISPPGGLFKFQNGKANRMNQQYDIASVLGWTLFYDNEEQLLWYGTLDQGLYKIPLPLFEYYSPSYFGEKHLKINDLLVDERNGLWILSDSLLLIKQKKKLTKIRYSEFINARLKYETKQNKDSNVVRKPITFQLLNKSFEKLSCIEQSPSREIYVSAYPVGIFTIDPKTYNIQLYHLANSRQFVVDEQEVIMQCDEWANSPRKVSPTINRGNVLPYPKNSEIPHNIRKIVKDTNNLWFCGVTEGIYYMVNDNFIKLNLLDSTIGDKINDVTTSGPWTFLGGNDGRIHLLFKSKDTLIKTAEFHCDESPVSWLVEAGTYLFISTGKGIYFINMDEIKKGDFHAIQRCDKEDGVYSTAGQVATVDLNQDIWIGLPDGVMKINTNLITNCKRTKNRALISRLELFNKTIKWDSITTTDPWSHLPVGELILQPDQNHLTFYFQTISFSDPENECYYYRLGDKDTVWNGPTDKRYVVYSNLPSGKYTFSVRSMNHLTNEVSSEASIAFNILVPWYRTWWFITLSIGVFAVFSVSIYIYRIKKIKQREIQKRKILSKISDLEARALQAQMNPHFIFNALSSIQNYVLDNDVDNALIFLSHFSKVIRLTFEHVDKKMITLDKELEYIENYIALEQMRFDDKFVFNQKIDPSLNTSEILIPPMIVQPFLENAIKHGLRNSPEPGILNFEIQLKNTTSYICLIEDNGIGRGKAKEIQSKQRPLKESKGVNITKERILLFPDLDSIYNLNIIDLFDDENNPCGTRVEITIPLGLR